MPEPTVGPGQHNHDLSDGCVPSHETQAEVDLEAIRKRYMDHEVTYERPSYGSPCWTEYRAVGRCMCNAEQDMQHLLAALDTRSRELEHLSNAFYAYRQAHPATALAEAQAELARVGMRYQDASLALALSEHELAEANERIKGLHSRGSRETLRALHEQLAQSNAALALAKRRLSAAEQVIAEVRKLEAVDHGFGWPDLVHALAALDATAAPPPADWLKLMPDAMAAPTCATWLANAPEPCHDSYCSIPGHPVALDATATTQEHDHG